MAQPSVVLGPGESTVVDVWLHPPPVSSTTAGANDVSVRVLADSEPSLSTTVDAVVHVSEFDERTLTFAQSVIKTRSRAHFDLIVRNGGNAMADIRLRLVDPSKRLKGDFDPPSVAVPPGDSSRIRMSVKAPRSVFRASDRLINFEVDAAESGHPTTTAKGAVLQPKTISTGWLGRLGPVLLGLGVVAGAWYWGAKPWVERRIDDEVNSRLTAQAAQSGSAVPAPQVSWPSSTPDAAEDRRPQTIRLAPSVAVGETGEESYTLESDQPWQVTDVVVQNPRRDAGRAVLRIDDQVWYEWDLALMTSPNEFQPRVTPLEVNPESTVTFSVACTAIGDNEANGCSVAAIVGGRFSNPGSSGNDS